MSPVACFSSTGSWSKVFQHCEEFTVGAAGTDVRQCRIGPSATSLNGTIFTGGVHQTLPVFTSWDSPVNTGIIAILLQT
ncbi:hypothetical protein Bpfe_003303 [Biomphalaria pfeifferi]|uniref:Uncharacterized protein n=1 Tax=Biomphalaria pfeifferi TaxID=112525 RepID=A0AAD8FK17_BIOPF|nr:hypothetical protein Bpfe_003303 [Biomphalaria pfeifferi]